MDEAKSVFERVEADGAAADLGEARKPERTDADAVRRLTKEAADALEIDPARALAAWDEAGRLQDLETLDVYLPMLGGRRMLGFIGRGGRARLLAAARRALHRSVEVGSVELAAAVMGELGEKADAVPLETLGVHPRLTLHAATALGNLRAWEGRLALLRLLHGTEGEYRVHVIDRLLAHTSQPAVRIALLRDALPGLDGPSSREIAPHIAEACRAQDVLDDAKAPEDLRKAAREVLRAAEP